MDVLLGGNIPVNLRFSVATVNLVVLRDTGGTLKAICITTFATSVHVGCLFAYMFRGVKITVTACYNRGLKTEGLSEVNRNMETSVEVVLFCFILAFLLVCPFTSRVVVLFISGNRTRIIACTTRFVHVTGCFCPYLNLLAVLHCDVRNLNCDGLSVLDNMVRVVTEYNIDL